MKRGFTLIELLAVILILGIIALIAIPTVNNILIESRKGAFNSTVRNILKSVSEKCTLQQIKNQQIDSIYILNSGKIYPELDIKGDLPRGNIYVNNNCEVSYLLYNSNFSIKKNSFSSEETIEELNRSIYNDPVLKGADPVLDYGMIPVVIENNGEVYKANLKEEWYDYNNKKWANAVLVKEDKRDFYLNALGGEIINANDIFGYFVWVPRFKYAIPSGTGARSIKIIFENIFNLKSYGSAVDDDYYTHPAFTFGNKELNGIWIAKFETSGEANMPLSLPNVQSINNQTIEEQFNSSLLLKNNKTYGVLGNSHMMKNTEWGAMAYLSHSIYGINQEIRINNMNPITTGCGASSDNEAEATVCAIPYGGGSESYPQSSTGNISGIFDISGGRFERLMAHYSATPTPSGFAARIEKKYYDLYSTLSYDTACDGSICKGHSLTETKNWYNDYYLIFNTSRTWIHRGGLYLNNDVAGSFFVDVNSGGTGSTYRVVLNNAN